MADNRGAEFLIILRGDSDGGSVLDYMVIGNNVAVLCQDKAGAGDGSLHALAVHSHPGIAGDGHHAVNIPGIDLGRSQALRGNSSYL